ncbi:guanine nucleotide-binding protein G(T) subunit gamma-T1 isoform X2 [Syngnathus typhle]|uniref:guanine nucleotide-binding protein G(T) subunit gamma-T1 isoform X2 n=1 Tax=Syngnathus typhle TaxID=161592 RepID=UPI002A6AB8BB|nr:guanine nucleotide-binding protein G(T) subunit gamma-T1 isoform X2 [Syngnathus typhle]
MTLTKSALSLRTTSDDTPSENILAEDSLTRLLWTFSKLFTKRKSCLGFETQDGRSMRKRFSRGEGFFGRIVAGNDCCLQANAMPVINVEDLTDKDKALMEVNQLKIEVKLQRWLTSKCCEEIKDYIQAGVDEDTLVKGISEEKNPFKEKGGCVLC